MALGTEAAKSFRENLESDPEIAGRLDRAVLDRAMDPRLHLAHVDAVLARVFGAPAEDQPGDVDGG
jgi:adenylosuccinate lyase